MEKINFTPENEYYLKIDELEQLRNIVFEIKSEDVIINKKLLERLISDLENNYWEAKEQGERD